jgi:hypothetical protein
MVKGAAIKFSQHTHLPLATFLMQLSDKPNANQYNYYYNRIVPWNIGEQNSSGNVSIICSGDSAGVLKKLYSGNLLTQSARDGGS